MHIIMMLLWPAQVNKSTITEYQVALGISWMLWVLMTTAQTDNQLNYTISIYMLVLKID